MIRIGRLVLTGLSFTRTLDLSSLRTSLRSWAYKERPDDEGKLRKGPSCMCMHYDDSRPTSEEYEVLNEAEVIVGVRYRKQRIFKIQISSYYLSIDVLGFPKVICLKGKPLIGMGLRLHKSRAPSSAASGLAARFQDNDTSKIADGAWQSRDGYG